MDKEKRHINRDVKDFERQEKQIMAELKKEGAKGDKERARALAKQLIRVRKSKDTVNNSINQLDNVKMQAKSMASNAAVAESLGKATKVMAKINNQTKVEDVMKRVAQYEREMEKSNMNQEIMDETLSSVFDGDGVEEETDEMVNKVLDEAGLANLEGLESAPMGDVHSTESGNKEKRASETQDYEKDLIEGI